MASVLIFNFSLYFYYEEKHNFASCWKEFAAHHTHIAPICTQQWLYRHIILHLDVNWTSNKSCRGVGVSWPSPAPAACLSSLCRPHWRRCSWVRMWTSSWRWDPECSGWWGWCCNSWTWWKAPGNCHRTLRCHSLWSSHTSCNRTETRVYMHEKMSFSSNVWCVVDIWFNCWALPIYNLIPRLKTTLTYKSYITLTTVHQKATICAAERRYTTLYCVLLTSHC